MEDMKLLKSIAVASAAKISASRLGNLPLPPPKAVPADPSSIFTDLEMPAKRLRRDSQDLSKLELAATEELLKKDGQDLLTSHVNVPTEMAGLVIGKGGQGIKAIEQDCGVALRITGSSTESTKTCVVMGGNEKNQERARTVIERIIAQVHHQNEGPAEGRGLYEEEILVPEHLVGSVIGINGIFLKRVKDTTGCRSTLDKETPRGQKPDRTIKLTGTYRAVKMGREQFELQLLECYRKNKVFNAELEEKYKGVDGKPPPPSGPAPAELVASAMGRDGSRHFQQPTPLPAQLPAPLPAPLPPGKSGGVVATVAANQHQEAERSRCNAASFGQFAGSQGSLAGMHICPQVPVPFVGLENDASLEYLDVVKQWAAFYARDSTCVSHYNSLRSLAARAFFNDGGILA